MAKGNGGTRSGSSSNPRGVVNGGRLPAGWSRTFVGSQNNYQTDIRLSSEARRWAYSNYDVSFGGGSNGDIITAPSLEIAVKAMKDAQLFDSYIKGMRSSNSQQTSKYYEDKIRNFKKSK